MSDVEKEGACTLVVAKEGVGSSGAVGFVPSGDLNLSTGSPNSGRCRFSLSKSPGWNCRKGVRFEFSLGKSLNVSAPDQRIARIVHQAWLAKV